MKVKHTRGDFTVDYWDMPLSSGLEARWTNVPWDQAGTDHGYGTFEECLELVRVFKSELCDNSGGLPSEEPLMIRIYNKVTKKAIILS